MMTATPSAPIRVAATLLTSLGLLVAAGCGPDDGLGRRYPVSGKVTYKNEPVSKGTIQFVPDDANGHAASGDIVDGTYSLTTLSPGDGALPGSYKVAILSRDVDMSTVQQTVEKQGGAGRQDDVAKAYKKAKNLIPTKYNVTSTSGLTAKVEEKSNSIDFPLAD